MFHTNGMHVVDNNYVTHPYCLREWLEKFELNKYLVLGIPRESTRHSLERSAENYAVKMTHVSPNHMTPQDRREMGAPGTSKRSVSSGCPRP